MPQNRLIHRDLNTARERHSGLVLVNLVHRGEDLHRQGSVSAHR
jgi:hypothetical protein